MSTPSSDKASPGRVLASVSASHVAALHTGVSALAFCAALLLGVTLHYEKIVRNQWYGLPDEWLPSVSATIGDWYPERNLFQFLIALAAGPRFLVILLNYILTRRTQSSVPGGVAICGLLRTLFCGGWSYVSSSDDGDLHDFFMIGYMILNIPWMFGSIALSSPTSPALRSKKLVATAFFGALPPLIYFYLEHKVKRVPGAYSIYALFEWSLICSDIMFDSLVATEFARLGIQFVDLGEAPLAEAVSVNMTSPLTHADDTPFKFEPIVATVRDQSSPWRHFVAESYLAFLFWSNLTALPPMIFFSSVWSMGLSGDEILLFSTLSPCILCISHIRQRILAVPDLFHLASLVGIAAFWIDDEGSGRLRVLAAALAVATTGFVSQWWAAARTEGALERHVWTFGAGLLFSLLMKHANHSINPVWPIMRDQAWGLEDNPEWIHPATGGYNVWALQGGVVALLTLLLRRPSADIVVPTRGTSTSRLAAAVGWGSMFFLVHWLFTDLGTVIAWTWAGHPISGPTAMPHGVLILLSLSLGFAPHSLSPLIIYPLSVASSLLLYLTKSWLGFLGGLGLAFSTASLFFPFTRAAAQHPPGSTFGTAFLIYAILELASVWTVAYAFVPGGNLLRERTDLVLGATMLGIGVGVLNLDRRSGEVSDKEHEKLEPSRRVTNGVKKRFRAVIVAVLLLSLIVVYHRRRLELPMPYHPAERMVSAGIWTMHFGLDGRMWESQRRIAELVLDAEIDVLGLLESDLQRIVMGNRDMTQYIAHTLGYYADIGPSPSSHTWGCALLSKFPIVNSTHLLLPSPVGELAPAIHATLDVYGTLVDVIVAHNGQEEDPVDRQLQSQVLAKRMSIDAAGRPVIFLGYVVTLPGAERPAPYQILVEDGEVQDVDPDDADRWCEYIMYRGLHRIGYARLNRGSNPAITDTELQLAKFIVPFSNATDYQRQDGKDEAATIEKPSRHERLDLRTVAAPSRSDVSGNHRVPQHHMLPEHRFPDKFVGEGVRGHRYQAIKNELGAFGPWYYLPPNEDEAIRRDLLLPGECQQQ